MKERMVREKRGDGPVGGSARGQREDDVLVEKHRGEEDEDTSEPVYDDEDVLLDGVGGEEAEEEAEAQHGGEDEGVPHGGQQPLRPADVPGQKQVRAQGHVCRTPELGGAVGLAYGHDGRRHVEDEDKANGHQVDDVEGVGGGKEADHGVLGPADVDLLAGQPRVGEQPKHQQGGEQDTKPDEWVEEALGLVEAPQ